MDLSLFATGGVELAPRNRRIVHDVALSVIDAPNCGVQLQILLSANAAKGFGDFAAVTWFAGGGIRVAPGLKGQFAMRHAPGSQSRQLRFTVPGGLLGVARRAEPVEWQRTAGGALLIVVPPSWLHDAAGAREEAVIARLCEDPESEPVVAVEPEAKPVPPVKPEPRRPPKEKRQAAPAAPTDPEPPAPALPVEAVPIQPAAYSHSQPAEGDGTPAPEISEQPSRRPFEVVRLGLAHVRTNDLPMLRDLATGKAVDDADAADWRRLREQLRDVQVLLPIGGGRLVPQSRAVLARLIKAYDAKVMTEAGAAK